MSKKGGLNQSHNPYFNRWFSAIGECLNMNLTQGSHNPYFNRWFSAMKMSAYGAIMSELSQSLF